MLLMLVMGIDILASKCEPRTMMSMRRVPKLTRPTTAGYGSSSTSPVRNLTFRLFCRRPQDYTTWESLRDHFFLLRMRGIPLIRPLPS